MASPGILDIPYFVGAYSNRIVAERAKKLRATADPGIFWKNAAQNVNHAAAMKKFFDVLVDQTPAPYKSSAAPLKAAATEGAKPEECSLSIALSGGGLRVISFLSFLEVMREHNIPIRAYAGTSAGSLATMLDRVGVNYETVWECLDEKMLKALLFALNANLGKGILSGNRVMDFVDNLLPAGLSTYGKVPFLYTTSVLVNSWSDWHGTGLIRRGKKEVYTGNPDSFSTFRPIVFSSEFDPSLKISQGIFSSMCLPVFEAQAFPGRMFTAIKGDGTTQPVMSTSKGWTIDGGYMDNYPVDILLLPDKANINPATHIIINVVADPPDNVELNQDTVKKLVYMANDVSSTSMLRSDRLRYADKNILWWTIGGEASGVDLFDFQKIDAMRRAGRESALKLLDTVGMTH
jgi:predicted acylesterase/phospholipase RssA